MAAVGNRGDGGGGVVAIEEHDLTAIMAYGILSTPAILID